MAARSKGGGTAGAKAKAGRTGGGGVYRLKITLRHSDPEIWRRVLVPGDLSLEGLHWVIQDAMGWENSHLHQFMAGKKIYSDPDFGLEEAIESRVGDEAGVTMREAAPRAGSSLVYEYDFGDSWEHRVKVEAISESDARFPGHPVCIEGERAAPPEDCGGIPGYYESFLPAIQDPTHEEHDEMLEWVGGSFDPEAFDIEAVNRALKRIK